MVLFQGIGLGTDSMCLRMEADECPSGGPYAIIVKGDDVEERKLDYHGVGRILDSSVVVRSNVIEGERRIVELTRPFQGATNDHFTAFVADPREEHERRWFAISHLQCSSV